MILTHGHFDHAGGLTDFPGAEVVIQRADRSLAASTTAPEVREHLDTLYAQRMLF